MFSYSLYFASLVEKIVNLNNVEDSVMVKAGEAKRSLNIQLSAEDGIGGDAAGMTKSKHIPEAAKNRGGLSTGRCHVRCGHACEIHATYLPTLTYCGCNRSNSGERDRERERERESPLRVLRRKGGKAISSRDTPHTKQRAADRLTWSTSSRRGQ